LHPGHASKIDYIKVLKDIQMQINKDGEISWAFASGTKKSSPYRVTIQKINNMDDTLSMLTQNRGSPKTKHQRNSTLRIKTMRNFLAGSTMNSSYFSPR
jgi:hypothetical protein